MKYTAVFINGVAPTGYTTKFFISSHDKQTAWEDIGTQTPTGWRLLFVIPGEQEIYTGSHISLTQVA